MSAKKLVEAALCGVVAFGVYVHGQVEDSVTIHKQGSVLDYESEGRKGSGRTQGPVTVYEVEGKKREVTVIGNTAVTKGEDGQKLTSVKVGPQTVHTDSEGNRVVDTAIGNVVIRQGSGSSVVRVGNQHVVSGVVDTKALETATANLLLEGSGKICSRSWRGLSFDQIRLNGVFDVAVICGKSPTMIRLTIDDNLLDQVVVEVKKSVLLVNAKGGFTTRQVPRLTIEMSDLKAVWLEGQDTMKVEGVKGESLAVFSEGSGEVFLSGKVKRFEGVLTGSGVIDAVKLKADDVNARLDGSGEIICWAEKNAAVGIGGAGTVKVKGGGRIVEQVTGAGTVLRIK